MFGSKSPPSSVMFVSPSTIAPAAFSFSTSVALAEGMLSCSAIEPPLVGRPATSIESFTSTGNPASGPRVAPFFLLLSNARASSTAFGFRLRTA